MTDGPELENRALELSPKRPGRDQEVEGSYPFTPSRCNNLRCVLNFWFCFVFTDKTDKIDDPGRKRETQPHLFNFFQTEWDIFDLNGHEAGNGG
jgi:hypothetical protein